MLFANVYACVSVCSVNAIGIIKFVVLFAHVYACVSVCVQRANLISICVYFLCKFSSIKQQKISKEHISESYIQSLSLHFHLE